MTCCASRWFCSSCSPTQAHHYSALEYRHCLLRSRFRCTLFGLAFPNLCLGLQSRKPQHLCRFDNVSGTRADGKPNDNVPQDVIASIKRNGVCLKVGLSNPSPPRAATTWQIKRTGETLTSSRSADMVGSDCSVAVEPAHSDVGASLSTRLVIC